MIKHLSVFILMALCIPLMVNAQSKPFQNLHKKALIFDVPTQTHHTNTVTPNNPADGDYILVDTMANAFGTGSSSINPLAYNQSTNTVAIVHRASTAYGTGSGELWYNISTDDGATWMRVASVNSGAFQQSARYPSMAISNSSFGTNAVFAWPELNNDNPDGWGFIGYGADVPIGAGAPYADITQIVVTSSYGSDAPNWASDNSDWVFWMTGALYTADETLFRTQDFATIETINPPQWSDTALSSWGAYEVGGVSYNGTLYVGLISPFSQFSNPNYIPIGYSKSTDDGLTWSDFSAPDFTTIPGLDMFDELMDNDTTDGNTVRYDGDIQVDYMGHVHLVTAVTDTDTYNHAVVDLYETDHGWTGEIVYSGLDRRAYGLGPGLGQMAAAPMVAMDSSHKVIGVQWINSNPTSGWADVFFSHKRLDDPNAVWSTPTNLTNSPLINNTAAHLAPQIEDNGGGSYTAFSAYAWQLGALGPYSDTTLATGLYVAPVPFVEMPVGTQSEVNKVFNFELNQNYPNPFNPTTKISYSIPARANVTLKVYNMLGQEVTTLVNGTEEAGRHEVNFNASDLASGLYIYKIQSGNFSQSKKMMLLK